MTSTPRRSAALPGGPYALTDRRLAGGRAHEEIVGALLAGGVRLIQIREKCVLGRPEGDRLAGEPGATIAAMSPAELVESVRRCVGLARAARALLIVNDDPDLAAETGADGVHVGQEDCPPRRAREILGADRIVGLSTHTREQFLAALEEPVDYVAFGPVFGTTSKESPYSALGLEFVNWAAKEARRRGLPLVCIGGITLENLPSLLRAAPECHPAVISALMAPGDIAGAARQFIELMRRAISSRKEHS